MDSKVEKSLGVKLVRLFNSFFPVIIFAVFPILVLFLLFLNFYPDDFASRLIYMIGVVFVLGGFLPMGIKIWELIDDKYINLMKGYWRSEEIMRLITYKVIIPKDFKHPVSDMKRFFYDLYPMNGSIRTKYEQYTEGADYYDLTFDIIIRGGRAEMYLSFPFKRKDMVEKAFQTLFPEITLIETTDPYKNWPKKWVKGVGVPGYKDMQAYDFELGGKDVFPFGNPSWFGSSPDELEWPLGELIENLKNYDPKATIVLQYIFRSFENVYYERWLKDLEEVKSEMLERSTKFKVTEDGHTRMATTGDLVTTKQKEIVDACESRIADAQYRCHFRFVLFYPPGKEFYGAVMDKFLKMYSGMFYYKNGIVKNWYTATDRYFLKSKFTFLDGLIGPLMNKFYHAKETEYRKIMHYFGLLNRKIDTSNDSMKFLIDVPSLSSMFHFPGKIGIFEELQNDADTKSLNQIQKESESPNSSFQKLIDLREKARSAQQVPTFPHQSSKV